MFGPFLTPDPSSEDGEGSPLSQILARHRLPMTVRFAHPQQLQFKVDKQLTSEAFFGQMLLTKVYDEPYLLCLSIDEGTESK